MTPAIWRLKASILRLLCPLFFRKIGKRVQFTGRVRLPMPFRNVTIGDDCMIGDSVYFQTGRLSKIKIGNQCSINTGCHLIASSHIVLGDNVAVGEYVSIRDQAHNFTVGHGVRGQGFKVAPVTVGNNVWIGRGVFIGPGTNIGANSIIGANSVVHGVFPPGVLIAGTPAVVKKSLLPKGETGELRVSDDAACTTQVQSTDAQS